MPHSEGAPLLAPAPLRRVHALFDAAIGQMRAHPHFVGAACVSLFSAASVVAVNSAYPHPTGTDPGQWISVANGYLGHDSNGINLGQYPPLFFLLLAAAISIAGSALGGLFIALGTVAFLLPLSAYVAYATITRDKFGALAFAVLVGFGHTLLDMVSWGGYPNLLGMSWCMLALAYFHRASTADRPHRDAILFGLFAGLTVLSHVLATFVLVGACGVYLACLALCGFSVRWFLPFTLRAAPLAAALVVPYAAGALLARAAAPSYLSAVEGQSISVFFFPLVPEGFRAYVTYSTNGSVAALGFAIAACLALLAVVYHRAREEGRNDGAGRPDGSAFDRQALLFIATILPAVVTPLALWLRRDFTDFARLAYFLYLPLAAAATYLLARLVRGEFPFNALAPKRTEAGPSASRAVRLTAALLVICLVAGGGLGQFVGAARFTSTFDDAADADLMTWARAHGAPGDVFLFAPRPDNEGATKWFAGLTGFRTLGPHDGGFLFFEAERDLNAQLARVFAGRVFEDNGRLEASADALVGGRPFDLALASLGPVGSAPIAGISDERQVLVLKSSEYIPLLPAAGAAPGGGPLDRTFAAARPEVAVERSVTFDGDALTLRWLVSGDRSDVTGVLFTFFKGGDICRRAADFEGVVLGLWRTDACDPFFFNGTPALEVRNPGEEVDFFLPIDENGSATLRVRDGRSHAPAVRTPRILESAATLEANSVDWIVFDRTQTSLITFAAAEYAATIAYANGNYVVLRR